MPLDHDTDLDSTTATVTVRIPRESNRDLATDAERRLSRPEGIRDVRVDRLCGIEPRLSATLVTVEATIRIRDSLTDAELSDRLADAPGFESVERFE